MGFPNRRDFDPTHYDRTIEVNPAFADAYNNRGAAFRGKGDLAFSRATRV
jgi:hypothetical protein